MRALIVAILAPIYVLIAWLIYLGAKWAAAFLTSSEIDQTVMAALAAIIVVGVIVAALMEMEREG